MPGGCCRLGSAEPARSHLSSCCSPPVHPSTLALGWSFLPMHRAVNWEKMEHYVLRAPSASSGQDSPASVVPQEHQGHGTAFSQPPHPSAPLQNRNLLPACSWCLLSICPATFRCLSMHHCTNTPQPFPALAFEIISLSISCYCSVFSGSSSSGGCSSPTLSKQLTNSLPGSNIFKMLIRMFILSSAKL